MSKKQTKARTTRKAKSFKGWALIGRKSSYVGCLYVGDKKSSIEYFEDMMCEDLKTSLQLFELKRVEIKIKG